LQVGFGVEIESQFDIGKAYQKEFIMLKATSQMILGFGMVALLASGCDQNPPASEVSTDTTALDSKISSDGCIFDVAEDAIPASSIDPDCTDNPRPRMCTKMVQALRSELNEVHNSFLHFSVNGMMRFYHPQGVVHAQGAFYRGSSGIRQLFTQLDSFADSADLDLTTFHFSVINARTVIAYGNISGTIYLKGGQTVPQSAQPETHTWVYNPGASSGQLPFLLASQHE
jgi:hypothetical protein